MKHIKMLSLAAVAAAALLAFLGASFASATTLTGEGAVMKTGSTIHAVLNRGVGPATLTTSFKNIVCEESTIQGTTSNESGTTVNATVGSLIFGKCNCEVKVISGGSIAIENVGNNSGSFTSTGAEITTTCSTLFGNVHCIYVTEATSLGLLLGGAPAEIGISGAKIPRLSTSSLCAEKANLDARYVVDNPGSLHIDN